MRATALVAVLALSLCVSNAAAARSLLQGAVTTRLPGTTGVLVTDTTSRTGAGQVLKNQAQAAARGGSAADPVGTLLRTREVGRASQATRATVGAQATQSAVQQAVRTGNAAGAAQTGNAVGRIAAGPSGRGTPVSSTGARATTAQMATSSAIQQAARGGNTASAATATGQKSAVSAQIQTSFGTPAGRR